MPYSSIDHHIRDWIEANALTLFEKWADADSRFCYLSSPRGECLQISIQPPSNDVVQIFVFDVETKDDEEVRLEWAFSVSDVRSGLDTVLRAVREWFERPQS